MSGLPLPPSTRVNLPLSDVMEDSTGKDDVTGESGLLDHYCLWSTCVKLGKGSDFTSFHSRDLQK